MIAYDYDIINFDCKFLFQISSPVQKKLCEVKLWKDWDLTYHSKGSYWSPTSFKFARTWHTVTFTLHLHVSFQNLKDRKNNWKWLFSIYYKGSLSTVNTNFWKINCKTCGKLWTNAGRVMDRKSVRFLKNRYSVLLKVSWIILKIVNI